ncbi:MAG: SoxR reducing system RseC family protein [Bacteroidales bacterium]|nr:SoxR reducing system RseC family protein [Candidatus Colimorpha onthohippi]
MNHSGTVVAVAPWQVSVAIIVESACAQCHAHGACGFAESTSRTMAIKTNDWERYKVGDTVMVSINPKNGTTAVAYAYIIPAALMLIVFFCTNPYWGDLWSTLLTILTLILYWSILRIFRKHTQRKFTFSISKIETS